VKFWGNRQTGVVKERGKEKFLTPHIFPIREDGGTKIFLADGALPGPYTSKISDPQILRVMGENVLKFFLLFRGQMRCRADLRNCRRYQSACCTRLLGMGQRVQCGGENFQNWVHFQQIAHQV